MSVHCKQGGFIVCSGARPNEEEIAWEWPEVTCQDCIDKIAAAQVIAHVKKNNREWNVYELIGGALYINGQAAVQPPNLGSTGRLALQIFDAFGNAVRKLAFSEDLGWLHVQFAGRADIGDVSRILKEYMPAGIQVDVMHLGL